MPDNISFQVRIKNPNEHLIKIGLFLLAVSILSVISNSPGIMLGLGVIVKILVLLWIPKAARLAGREPVGWTILIFLTPSLGMIILGAVGIKDNAQIQEVTSKCSKHLESFYNEIKVKLDKGECTEEEFMFEFENKRIELEKYASEFLLAEFDKEGEAFLDKQLEKQGFVLNEDSEVFVDYKDKCPACGSEIKGTIDSCTDCGLSF